MRRFMSSDYVLTFELCRENVKVEKNTTVPGVKARIRDLFSFRIFGLRSLRYFTLHVTYTFLTRF